MRQFEDKRKQYNPALPNPVLHLSSRDLAQHAAGVYAANGIHAHILPPDSTRYLATPELSFTIRFLQAHGGLNISASHNPPDDNGGKFYDERGGQPVPPDDQIMADLVDQVTHIKALPWAEAARSGRVHFLDDDAAPGLHRPVPQAEPGRRRRVDETSRSSSRRCTASARMTAMEVLVGQGFRVVPVAEQMTPDGQFPNVTKTPNPEVPESMDRAAAAGRAAQGRPGALHRPRRRPPRRDGPGSRRRLALRHRQPDRRPADALQAEQAVAARPAAAVADRRHAPR